MLHRKTELGASFFSVWLFAALAMAQTPGDSPLMDSDYPTPNSSFLNDSDEVEGINLDWQWRFQADALYLTRNNSSRDIPVISGPEAFRFHDLDFDYKPGTRLTLGIMNDDYELDIVATTLSHWSDSRTGILTHAVDFDGPVAYGAAAVDARNTVDLGGTPNFLTSNTFFSPINTAALTGAESNELEFLKTGAKFTESYTSRFQDFEFNYKKRQQPGRFARFGLGYRNTQFGESGRAALSGTFGTIDAVGTVDEPNDGLANGSLTGAGLSSFFTTPATAATNTTPATIAAPPANGFSTTTEDSPDELLFTTNVNTRNLLNGVQVTSDFAFLEIGPYALGGYAKAGVFHNAARGTISERYTDTQNDGSIYTRRLSDSKNTAAFLGQAGLASRLYLRHNIRLFSSYEVIFLSGLALAPDQMRAVNTTVTGAAVLDLKTQGSAFIHGGRVGLEILFP